MIGADFLRAAKPKPDGMRTFHVGGGMLTFEKLTPEEREELRTTPPRPETRQNRKGPR